MELIGHPFFSIIISVYNRPSSIKKCVQSCLDQIYNDFEIIVVDDGSSDNTPDIVLEFNNPKIKLIRHKINKGMGAARNTGITASIGEWIVRLDSDFELMNNALHFFSEKISEIPEHISMIGARFKWDTGQITPVNVPKFELDYIKRIKWVEDEGGTDFISCIKKNVFDTIKWFECYGHSNGLFQLDLAYEYKSIIFDNIIAYQYSNAPASQLRAPFKERWDNRIKSAKSQLDHFNQIINKHGNALRLYGPNQYKFYLINAAFYGFLSNNKKIGRSYCKKYINIYSISVTCVFLYTFGSINVNFIKIFYFIRHLLKINSLI